LNVEGKELEKGRNIAKQINAYRKIKLTDMQRNEGMSE
jgi:hypothetical protein